MEERTMREYPFLRLLVFDYEIYSILRSVVEMSGIFQVSIDFCEMFGSTTIGVYFLLSFELSCSSRLLLQS